MHVIIRPLTKSDEPFLWDMLYQAIYVPQGQTPPPREIIFQPELAWYVKGWGRESDCGFLASTDGQAVGAIWLRFVEDGRHGYGYVDDDTPELSMALLPDYRGKGIGTQLFKRLFASPGIHPKVSLSVSAKNPAFRLYERVGFEIVGQDGESLTMIRIEK
jgi:ribosomal protein S18 acetylase RimI-like enzyme